MSRRPEQDDGTETFEGGDLRSAMKKLSKGSMKFAFGYTEDRKPVLVMHRSKSAQALGKELKEQLGAKTTHGVANAEGEELVLDVEGPRVKGMAKGVKLALRREHITTYKQARVRVGGEEDLDDEGEEGGEGAIDQELVALRDAIARRGSAVTAMLQRLPQGNAEDRAALVAYCRDCAELESRTRDCGDSELASFGKSSAGRALKIAGLLKGAASASASPGAPAGAPGGAPGMCAPPSAMGLRGSVGKGGKNNAGDVTMVQSLLAGQGYSVAVDGKCGPGTIAAIVAFQRAHGCVCDGLVDPGRNTWRALCGQAPVPPKPYPQPPKQYPPKPTYEKRPHQPLEYERQGGSGYKPPIDYPPRVGYPEPPIDYPPRVGYPEQPIDYPPRVGYPEPPVEYQPRVGYPEQPTDYPPQVGYPEPPVEYQPRVGYPEQPTDYPPQVGYPEPPTEYPPQVGYPEPPTEYPPQVGYQEQPTEYPPQVGYPEEPTDYPPQVGYQEQPTD